MGLVKICRYRRARIPFLVEQAGLNLYSLEELAYFLYHNICLADRHLFEDGRLCQWISQEIGFGELSERIQDGVDSGAGFQDLVLETVRASGMFGSQELSELAKRLRGLGSLKEQERLKMQADELLDNRKEWAAAREYQRILHMQRDIGLGMEFYGAVWNNLGVCYAKQFLFREAYGCFEASYRHHPDEKVEQQAKLAQKLSKGEALEPSEEGAELLEPQKTLLKWEEEYRVRQKP